MKAVLEFNLPEEKEEHNLALNGLKYKNQLDDIWQILFRPRHKYGYNDKEIDKLINSKNGEKIMDFLEQQYINIINED